MVGLGVVEVVDGKGDKSERVMEIQYALISLTTIVEILFTLQFLNAKQYVFFILMYIYRVFQNNRIYNILYQVFFNTLLSFKISKKIHKSFLTLNPSIVIYMEKVIS